MINIPTIINSTKKLIEFTSEDINTYNQDIKSSLDITSDIFDNINQIRVTSEAWYTLGDFLPRMWLSHDELSVIVMCGEEIILSTFIARKVDPAIDLNELKDTIIKITKENNPTMEILHDAGFYHLERYYSHCSEFCNDLAE